MWEIEFANICNPHQGICQPLHSFSLLYLFRYEMLTNSLCWTKLWFFIKMAQKLCAAKARSADFLSNPIGTALFKNLILFQELSQDDPSLTITVPISRSLLNLLDDESTDTVQPFDPGKIEQQPASEQGFLLRIVLLQKRFPNNRKANIGLIAHEVAHMFSSNDHGTKQVIEMLSEPEVETFTKMDTRLRTNWLIEKWGFREEHEAFRSELTQSWDG